MRTDKSSIREVSLDDALRQYSSSWADLVHTRNCNISHLPEWLSASAHAHHIEDKIRILTWHNSEGKLSSIIPVGFVKRTVTGIPLRSLEIGAGCVSYHNNWLALSDNQDTLPDLFNYARQHKCDAIHFAGVPVGTSTSHQLEQFCAEGVFCIKSLGESSPVLPIDNDWDGYLVSCNKKWRYSIRKLLSAIDNNDRLSIRKYEAETNIEELLQSIMQIEQNSWKVNEGTAIIKDGLEHKYYIELLPILARMKAILSIVIYFDDKPIAYNLCYYWNGEVGSMKTSYDEAYKDMSPGTLSYCVSVQDAFFKHAKQYDFLGDQAQHKSKWTDRVVAHEDHLIFLDTIWAKIARLIYRIRAFMMARIKDS